MCPVFVDGVAIKPSTIDTVKESDSLMKSSFKENLAPCIIKQASYAARKILKTIKSPVFTDTLNANTKRLKSIKRKIRKPLPIAPPTGTKENMRNIPYRGVTENIENSISTKNYVLLDSVSHEALENLSSNKPYILLRRGLALNKKK